jgi:F-type H+-transporting ATPase subunit a
LGLKILAAVFLPLGFFGALQALGLLNGVPIFQFGIPAVLSIYFDVFSGFVQALVFSLLSMVYIASACPAPEETEQIM